MNFEKNHNQSIITRLAVNSLKKHKLRNLFSGIIISLATCLLVMVALLGYNGVNDLKEQNSYHARFLDLTESQIEAVRQNPDVEKIGLNCDTGIIRSDNVTLGLFYSDPDTMDLTGISLEEGGRMPENADEILIEREYLQALALNKKVGDSIELTFRNNVTKEFQTKTFMIAGFLNTYYTGTDRSGFNCVVSKAFIDTDPSLSGQKMNIVMKVADPDSYVNQELKDKVAEIGISAGLEKNQMAINNSYIDGQNTSSETLLVAVVIGLVILISCTIVIYSIFYVGVVGRVKEYGQLRTIGTTRKQMKKMVSREGSLLCAVFIPIGMLLGCPIAYLMFPRGWYFKEDLLITLAMGVVTFLAVHVALRKPRKIAANVSPIEAVRYNAYQSGGPAEKRPSSQITPTGLGLMNLKRNRKRTALTLLSLGLSGMLFIGCASFMSSLDPRLRAMQRFTYGGEYKLQLNMDLVTQTMGVPQLQMNNPLDSQLLEQLLTLEGIDSIIVEKNITCSMILPNGEPDGSSISEVTRDKLKEYQKLDTQGNLEYDSYLDGNSILVANKSYYQKAGITFQVGDQITLTLEDGNDKFDKTFTIAGVIDGRSIGGTFFLPPEVMDELTKVNCNFAYEILSSQGYSEALEQQLNELTGKIDLLQLATMHQETEEMRNVFSILSTAAYVLVGFIACFGLINLINTSITSVISRRLEIGVLQSIGLTTNQLKKMLRTEGLFFTIGTVLFSVPIGGLLGYLVYYVFYHSGTTFLVYRFPVVPIICLIAIMAVTELILSAAISKSLQKQTMVERLRESE